MIADLTSRILTFWIPGKKRRKAWRKRLINKIEFEITEATERECLKATKKVELFKKTYTDVIQNKKYEIISLGYDCFSRTLPTRWGLKKSKEQGNLSCPFDLSQHSPEAVWESIRTDFSHYFDHLEYEPETGFWLKSSSGIIYNHDTDIINKPEFFRRYQDRITNFRQLVKADKPLFFVFKCRNGVYIPIIEAFKFLKDQREGKTSKLIIISSFKNVKIKSDDVLVINAPLYSREYCWFKDFRTKQGVTFESKIIWKMAEYLKVNIMIHKNEKL